MLDTIGYDSEAEDRDWDEYISWMTKIWDIAKENNFYTGDLEMIKTEEELRELIDKQMKNYHFEDYYVHIHNSIKSLGSIK